MILVSLILPNTVFRALSKNFLGKDDSAPLEKIGPYAYGCVLEKASPVQ